MPDGDVSRGIVYGLMISAVFWFVATILLRTWVYRTAGLWQLRLPRSLWITYIPRDKPQIIGGKSSRLVIWLGQWRLWPRGWVPRA